jgi:hypothetical protein
MRRRETRPWGRGEGFSKTRKTRKLKDKEGAEKEVSGAEEVRAAILKGQTMMVSGETGSAEQHTSAGDNIYCEHGKEEHSAKKCGNLNICAHNNMLLRLWR